MAIPKNNLEEQLARYHGRNTQNFSTPGISNKTKNSFKFHKLSNSTPSQAGYTSPFKHTKTLPESLSDNNISKSLHSSSQHSCGNNKPFTPPLKARPPPVAYVAPVVSNVSESTQPVSPATNLIKKTVSHSNNTHAAVTSSQSPPGSRLALSVIPSSSLNPVPATPPDKLEVEQKLSEVHRERVSTMDDVCELLSDIPAKDLTSLFGISASHMQRKLAKRKQLLKVEDELKRKLESISVHNSPSIVHTTHTHIADADMHPLSATTNTVTNPIASTGVCAFDSEAVCEWKDEDMLSTPDDEAIDEFAEFALPVGVCDEIDQCTSSSGQDHTHIPFHSGQGHTPLHSAVSFVANPAPSLPAQADKRRASFGTQSHNPQMFRPSSAGREGPQDNAVEFRKQYQHTKELFKVFTQVFGLKQFRPNQLEAVNAAILGENCFVLMPTGGGKSLCYQLPALMTAGVTVVVSPLRSLIQDQVQKLCSLEIPARHLSSDISHAEESEVYGSLSLSQPSIKLLYVTPEKLGASNKLISTLRGLYNRRMLVRFVIDEAHCISQWGHDFRPDYKRLNELPQKFPGVPIMALTATATPKVRADILHQLNVSNSCKWFTQSFNRTNLQYLVVPKKPKKISQDIIELIKKSFSTHSGIVYCLSRRDCDLMSGELCKSGISSLAYHAGLRDDQRSTVQQRWLQEDCCKVVCATIAFGMGIDKPDVRFVIHHSLPKSMEGYYQEAGRAGRDGLPAKCILFYSYSDMARLRRMIRHEKLRAEQERVHMENLYRMVQYCENETDCRRVQLLEYFAENFDPAQCRGGSTPCDNCLSKVPYHEQDVTNLVRVVVKSVQMVHKNRYTLPQYLEAIKGSNASKILNSDLSTLPLYKKGERMTKHDIERLLHLLVMKDILAETLTVGSHDNIICYVKLGSKSNSVLTGRIVLKIKGKAAASCSSKTSTESVSIEGKLKSECYSALLKLRMSVAQQFKVKNPECVLSTATLQAMSKQLPKTKEEMINIEGMSEVRWKNFDAVQFLEITQQFAAKTAPKKAGLGDKTNTKSPYFTGQEKKQPGVAKRKRKNVSSKEPSAKRQATMKCSNSDNEFETPCDYRTNNTATTTNSATQRRLPQLMPYPVPQARK